MRKQNWKRSYRSRRACLLLAAALLAASMWGCSGSGTGENGQGNAGQTGQTGMEQEQEVSQAEGLALKPEEYPRVDGSTATIPLSEGFASSVMHLPLGEARQYILHNTTHLAYENLIDGKADLIFVTSPSTDELAYAKEKGVDLEVVPIVSEGFVFLTGKDNPVDSLTFDQIKEIYCGKLTNWKDAGGPDSQIIAYQRPDNSGSQTGMYELVVPAGEIMKAPMELKPYGMGDLVDAVAEYQSGANTIGYSYYYYVTDMWKNENIKLLSVDGVYPDAGSIRSGDYPIRTAYYAVMRWDMPKDSSARKLLSWILSDEGQNVAEEAGYVKLGK